ncbi:MAG: hypothetical protein U0Q55_02130 [Vicinamibacterales bacterium]
MKRQRAHVSRARGTPEYRTVCVRPSWAVGSKSYFAERAYVRPEVTLGFNNHGLGGFGARLAFGVDF